LAISGKNKDCIKTVFSAFFIIIMAISMAQFAFAAGPPPINLGSARSFAIVARTSITNTPTSNITGDVALSPAAGNLLDTDLCGEVAGNVYVVSAATSCKILDPATANGASGSRGAAYIAASDPATPAGTGANFNVGNGTLNGDTFTPTVWTWNTSVTITGDIIINGAPNDVWVFQVDGDLDLQPNKKIIMAGGARAQNVFWQVTGQTTLSPGSHFEGRILGNQGITMQTGASINGSLMARTFVALDSNKVINPTPNTKPPLAFFIVINDGNATTANANLSLRLFANNANRMRFSCNNRSWTAWEPYNTVKTFDLNTSGAGCNGIPGVKRVFFNARNLFNLSAFPDPVSDSISLILHTLTLTGESGVEFGSEINVSDKNDCTEAEIYKDHTSRTWMPNDQTIYTASEYGTVVTNRHGYSGYEVPLRQNYIFTGETMNYFVIVEDKGGADTISDVRLVINMTNPDTMKPQKGTEVGRCAEVTDFTDVSHFISDKGHMINSYDTHTMKSYVCTLVAQDWTETYDVGFRVRTTDRCAGIPNVINSTQSDWLNFNPTLSIGIDGTITFGKTAPGSTSLSNTVYVENRAEANSGVVMDMYIAASDYFTDPYDTNAVCGDGNGIKYDRFGYYATKGSLNSGSNNNLYPGLGENIAGLCEAGADEFTTLPSYSGAISDMCHIINHDLKGSLLTQGARMSLTFKLDVPDNCKGTFTDGQFWIVGRVV